MEDSLALVDKFLQTDLDEWTRQVVRRHFDPDTGSPYWLKRVPDLGFDPREITRYEELGSFGPFPLATLRELDPADLIPQDVPRPIDGRVFDSGGTTGDPCRVLYTPRILEHRLAWRHWSFANEGFRTGGNWIQGTPTGPHVIGLGIPELSSYGGRMYIVDIDPRWVKRLIRAGKLAEADEYTDHVIEQIVVILRSQRIDYLNTTSALLSALIRRAPELAAELQGVRISGTHVTPTMFRSFKEVLGDGIVGRSYGNTFGTSAGIPEESNGDILPYLPNYPNVTAAVVDKEDWTRAVGFGELGQVKLTVLHPDLFLPNILERDQALRYDTGDTYPCDGVANVMPLQVTRKAPEGIY
ncbi:arylcarboxylate reductase [Streptantibioticus ferralitis]|uniref:Arylcarboxylate reductase n=1 Tax=Streptantibioticus ferralitis TaxID=236510 RepID=A0ABT5Z8H5_9ACTN|nr:arylcarboxylate reductase [Streptantibioticus ferralitis]MDF2260104.1 arylcarboxylate reductase [Streptantibioticus ferralitis]